MADFDASCLVCVYVTGTHHVEHECSGMVRKVGLALNGGAVDAVPVHFFLRVDTACDILVGQQQVRDGLLVKANVSVDEHEVVMVTLKEHPCQVITRPCDKALVHNLTPRYVDANLTHLVHGHKQTLHIVSCAHAPVHGGGNHNAWAFSFFGHLVPPSILTKARSADVWSIMPLSTSSTRVILPSSSS